MQNFLSNHRSTSLLTSVSFCRGSLILPRIKSSSYPRKVKYGDGPSSLSHTIRSPRCSSLQQQTHGVAALVPIRCCYDQEVIQVVNDKFHPCCVTIHSSALARAINILGADCKPNGRAVSMNSESSHIILISHLSFG